MICAGLALSGCSAKVSVGGGDKEMAESAVEAEAAKKLAESVGSEELPEVDCPGPLKAEVGTTMECVLTAPDDNKDYTVTLTVTEVNEDDGTIKFDAEVGTEPIE